MMKILICISKASSRQFKIQNIVQLRKEMADRLETPQPRQHDSDDVTLVVKDRKEFRASRKLLSTASPFFSALLHSDMRENKERIIRLEHITSTVMRDVLEFMQCGSVEITSRNAQDLIKTADFLFLPKLKTIAGRFLKDNLSASNCISYYYLAEKYQRDELLVRKVRKFILSNFAVVAESKDFLNLESQQVEQWISSSEIAVSSEDDVIKIILKWIEQSRSERKGKLEELFRHVRLALASRDYLKKDVVTNDLVKENSGCLKLVRDTIKRIHGTTDKDSSQSGRNWQPTHLVVLAGNNTLCYDPDKETWYRLSNAHRVYKRYNLLSFRGNLYVIPHYNFRAAERYDTFCDRWVSFDWETSQLKPMARLAAVVGTEMCAIDYTWKTKNGCHVMRYNNESSTWQTDSSCSYDQCHRGASGACAVALDSYFYVIGGVSHGGVGKNGHLVRPIKYAVRFNTIGKKWERIANLQWARYNACGVAARGKIFIAGGIIGGARPQTEPEVTTETCEMYNVSTNEWQFIASLHAPRKDGSMVYLRGCLYVVGGGLLANGEVASDALVVESYDFERNTWKPKTKIPILPSRPNSHWNDIKACTLTVNKKMINRKKSITRPLVLS